MKLEELDLNFRSVREHLVVHPGVGSRHATVVDVAHEFADRDGGRGERVVVRNPVFGNFDEE